MSSSKPVDREAPVQGALVIHPDREGRGDARLPAARLEEAAGLALALDLEVRETLAVNLRKLTPATLFGKGKEYSSSLACFQFSFVPFSAFVNFRRTKFFLSLPSIICLFTSCLVNFIWYFSQK